MRLILLCLAAILLAGCDKPVHEAHLPAGSFGAIAIWSAGQ